MVDKPKMVDKLVTAAMLTIAVSLFLSMNGKSRSQTMLESFQTALLPVQVVTSNR